MQKLRDNGLKKKKKRKPMKIADDLVGSMHAWWETKRNSNVLLAET